MSLTLYILILLYSGLTVNIRQVDVSGVVLQSKYGANISFSVSLHVIGCLSPFLNILYFIQVSLSAFGRQMSLELSRNRNLVPESRPVNLYFAENDADDISYVQDTDQVGAELFEISCM